MASLQRRCTAPICAAARSARSSIRLRICPCSELRAIWHATVPSTTIGTTDTARKLMNSFVRSLARRNAR